MKRILLSTLFSLLSVSLAIASEECWFSPTAKITNTPSGLTFRSGDEIQFSGLTSTPNNCSGYITTYQWTIQGSTYSGSTKNYTFILPANVHEQTYTVSLKVWNNLGLHNTKTITITVKRPQRIYHIADHLGSVRTSVDVDGNVVGHDDYYPFGKVMPNRSDNTSNPNDDMKFTGHEQDEEANLILINMNARGYDPIIGVFMQIDPLEYFNIGDSPYAYSRNNPLRFIDPDGRREYDCSNWTEQEIEENLEQGDWCKSDRADDTARWREANEYNLRLGRSSEYQNIRQRADFYSWFGDYANDLGYDVRWPHAASKIASNIDILTWRISFAFGLSNEYVSNFASVGNRMIFEDVFSKLKALTDGNMLNSEMSTFAWDALMLAQEQSLIQPLYENTWGFNTLERNAKFNMFAIKAIPERTLGVKAFSGDLMNVNDRWAYGMNEMGYPVTGSQMPNPGSQYQDKTFYVQLRNAGAGGKW